MPDARAEEPLLDLADDAAICRSRAYVPEERGFRIHVDSEAEGAGLPWGHS